MDSKAPPGTQGSPFAENIKAPFVDIEKSTPSEWSGVADAGWKISVDGQLESMQTRLNSMEEKNKGLSRSISARQKELDSIKRQAKGVQKSLEGDRYKNVEIISIVAAFFAFIATEFQLFAHLKSFWQFLSVSFVVFGCTSFFALIMARVARDPGKYNGIWDFIKNNKLLIVSILAMLAGAATPFFTDKSTVESRDNYIRTRHQACGDLTNHMGSFDFSSQDSVQKYEQLRKKYDSLQCSSPDLLR